MQNYVQISSSYATGSISSAGARGIAVNLNSGSVQNAHWVNHTGDDAKFCYVLDGDYENTGCTAVSSGSYFFDYSHSPMNSWDFTDIWNDSNEGSYYPTLQVLSMGCPNNMAGSGTIEDPCQITGAADLNASRLCLGCNYTLTADIDLDIAPYNTGGRMVANR